MPSRKVYRAVPEGSGGTFKLQDPRTDIPDQPNDDDLRSLAYIGTYGCYTCLGVYFKVDETRCFVAHINAWAANTTAANTTAASTKQDKTHSRNVSLREGEAIKLRTLQLLQAEAKANEWSPDHPFAAPSLIMVCPEAFVVGGLKCSGAYVADAICEFLSIPKGVQVDVLNHGFIVSKDREEHRFKYPESNTDHGNSPDWFPASTSNWEFSITADP